MITQHHFSPVILREYDIRGVVGDTLHVEDALALGRVFGTHLNRLGGKKIMVGYDGRTHSVSLEQALVDGLQSVGCDVVRIGLGPSPMLYFSVHHAEADAGIMVTGSHNPADQNGFKMMIGQTLPQAGSFWGEDIQKLAEMAATGDVVLAEGSVSDLDVKDIYVDRLLADLRMPQTLKVAWDAGNGSGGEILSRLVQKMPGEHILLYDAIDGTFPNHHPDPTVAENLKDLQAAVAEHDCDLGIAFDGDADRIGAVDGQGRILAGDQLLAIYATEVLKTHPGAPIIADVKASQSLFDWVASLGGKPVMWKTGHSLIKTKMHELNAPLAGEMSGHIFFADRYYGFDDALYCGLRLISIVSESGRSLASWYDDLPQMINTPEIRFPVDAARKFCVIDEIKEFLADKDCHVDTTDGVRVLTKDGWWLLRASNTQEVLVTRAEASTEEGLNRLKGQITDSLTFCGIKPPRF